MISTALVYDAKGPTLILKFNERSDLRPHDIIVGISTVIAQHNDRICLTNLHESADFEALLKGNSPALILGCSPSGFELGTAKEFFENNFWFCEHDKRFLNLTSAEIPDDWTFPTTFIYKFKKVSL